MKMANVIAVLIVGIILVITWGAVALTEYTTGKQDRAYSAACQEPEEVEHSLPIIPEDVLITINGVITNATADEVVAAHDRIVQETSKRLGTNGLKLIYVEFR